MKKILFVINTLGRTGAEKGLVELLKELDPKEFRVSLYVVTGQGELIDEVPANVRLLNKHFNNMSVLNKSGRRQLIKTLVGSAIKGLAGFRLIGYMFSNLLDMLKHKRLHLDKLAWRLLSEAGPVNEMHYDYAVAFLEGGSAYYVADRIKADKKLAFVHVDYEKAGYTRKLDRDCFLAFDRVLTVSSSVKKSFLKVYPELEEKIEVFHLPINREEVKSKSLAMTDGWGDYDGLKLISICRLTAQKALNHSIDAMKQLIDSGIEARWYVLGEGDKRKELQAQIDSLGLSDKFVLLGATDNPFPYLRETDIFIQASLFEGRSFSIQEALILGKPVIVSDCPENVDLVEDKVNGLVCQCSGASISQAIKLLAGDKELREILGENASKMYKGEDWRSLIDSLK